MNRNKRALKSWSIKAMLLSLFSILWNYLLRHSCHTSRYLWDETFSVFFPQTHCYDVINVLIYESNQTKCRPVRRYFQVETLVCLVLGPTHHSSIILIYCSLFIYKNPIHNIVGSKMTMTKCGWGVKWSLRIIFFFLHKSSALTILKNSNPHMKVKDDCTRFLLTIEYFF